MQIFCERLRAARKIRDMTQQDVERESGIYASSIAQFETGARKPSMDSLKKLAVALNISVDFLFGLTDTPAIVDFDDALFRLPQRDIETVKGLIGFLAERSGKANEKG